MTVPTPEVGFADALRYLSQGGAPDGAGEMLPLFHRAVDLLREAAAPRAVQRRLPLAFCGEAVQAGELSLPGADIARHLTGCAEAILFAATLGPTADGLIHRTGLVDPALGTVIDAAASVMIENVAEGISRDAEALCAAEGLRTTPRFSPGYGDLPLSVQRPFLALLQAPKRIGLYCNEQFLLTPLKSITAVIGVGGAAKEADMRCARCGKTDCTFRAEATDKRINCSGAVLRRM